MISLIVCSRREEDFLKLQQNVLHTVGCIHEIIRLDNSANHYSISRAYNEGARASQYPYLCFLHEDVAFATTNWGPKLIELLRQEAVGLVGIAGGVIKTKATGPTWWSPLPESGRINLIQGNALGEKQKLYQNPRNEPQSQVATLDGVVIASRKEVWKQFPFDEKVVKGFHFYDLDFSLSVGTQYKVLVTYDILLEHFSEGRNDKVWAEQADLVMQKWKSRLPMTTIALSKAYLQKAEKQTEDFFLHVLFRQHCSFSLKAKYVFLRILHSPTDWKGNLYFLKQLVGI